MKAFEVGKTYKNGHGQDVRILCTDAGKGMEGHQFPIVGLVRVSSGEVMERYTTEGLYFIGDRTNRRNLIPDADVRTVFVNVYPDDVDVFRTARRCVVNARPNAIVVAQPVNFTVEAPSA